MRSLVALDQPLDRQAHLFLGEPAHLEQPVLELLELLLKMPDDASDRFHRSMPDYSEPSRDVVFGQLFGRRREDLVRSGRTRPACPSQKNAVTSETRAACCMLCVTMTIV